MCNSSLSFFDPKGMRFHLPAYLIAQISGEFDGLEYRLTQLDGRRSNFALFSEEQREAVRRFLRFIVTDSDYKDDWKDIQKALAGYWA